LKQRQVAAGKLIVVRESGCLRDPGQCGVSPALGGCTEPRQTVLEEPPEQFWKPAAAVEGVCDPCSPTVGDETGVAGDATSGPGASVEIEGVHQREANEVSDRLPAGRPIFPVDRSGDATAVEQEVPAPEIAVDECPRGPAVPEPPVNASQPLEVGIELLLP
jgi:hypothetical protein